ncbi:Zn(II)2Cys6 transcription factor [Aspergillus foveolatus]|uniref:Zn(II)2Cys6 transcription factor n=1 Tax=Aspergillus foveolatus TaxID=210207 RepID=UPI003CCCC547
MDPDLDSASPRSESRVEDDQPPPSKKVRTNGPRRKPACQTCRRRKIRCDNGQPACGYCHTNEIPCVYTARGDERTVGQQELAKVFERLDSLSQAVENIQHLLISRNNTPLAPRDSAPAVQLQRPERVPKRAQEWQQDYLQIPACRCSADAVLTWPIFGSQFRDNSLITTLFQYSSDGGAEHQSVQSAHPDTGGFRITPDEHIPALVDQFIQNVHTKNPILDLEALVRSARHAGEYGLQWDAQSCLVLLACALGCISQPFTSSRQGHGLGWGRRVSTSSSLGRLREGEAFFMMARKRIGLLNYSVIGAECHFFAGVYLMYTFRPLPAWNHFYQASTFYRLRLRLIEGLDRSVYEAEQQPPVAQRLEQSLYWSCFKSEVEIRVELPLPQSAIAEYEYPALFPTPPTLSEEYPTRQGQNHISDWDVCDEPASGPEPPDLLPGQAVYNHITRLFNEEQSWYYYLTEVALRRIGNRVLNAFYREDSSTWANVRPLIPMALEFESQINAWFANLPPSMRYYESGPDTTQHGQRTSTRESISLELSWAIGNRFLEIRLWLYQPFLYYAVHHYDQYHKPPPIHTEEESTIIQDLVNSGIDCTLKILQARCLRHRHHGIWFDLRALVTASLIVIAFARSGTDSVELARIYRAGLRTHLTPTLETLAYWADEAPDIKRAREVLDGLLEGLE